MSSQKGGAQTPGTIQLVAFATLMSNVIFACVLGLMRAGGILPEDGLTGLAGDPTSEVLVFIVVLVGVMATAGSFPFRKVLERNILAQHDTLQNRLRVVLVSIASSEWAGIMGFVLGLITGDLLWAMVLMGISLAAGILHFPKRAWLEQAEDEIGGGDSGGL